MNNSVLRPIKRDFYDRPADQVAKSLLGTIISRKWKGQTYLARIVETEAYCGREDKACHAHKGKTLRNEIMFGPPGYAYVYLIYGVHDMFNIVTHAQDNPHAVLIRAAEPMSPNFPKETNMSGPGKLTKVLGITKKLNGHDLCQKGDLWLFQGPHPKSIVETTRVGIDYADDWVHAKLRFYEEGNPHVSVS